MSKKIYKIKDLVDIFGLTTRTLRFWEEKELLNALLRVPGKRRVYGEDVIKRIKDIQKLKSRGLALEDIKVQLEKKDMKRKVLKNSTRIIVGSSSGIDNAYMEKFEIDLLPSYIFLDGRKYVDGVNISEKDIEGLNCKEVVTSAPTVEDFIYTFSEMVEEGAKEIISFHPNELYCSSLTNARQAVSRVKGVKIHLIDTCSFGQIAELLAVKAREKLNEGNSVEKTLKYIIQLIADHSSYLIVSSMANMSKLGLVDIDFKEIVNPLFRVAMDYYPLIKINNQTDRYELLSRSNGFKDAADELVSVVSKDLEKNKFPAKMIGVYYTCNKDNLKNLLSFLKGAQIPVFLQKSNFYMSASLGTESVSVNIIYER